MSLFQLNWKILEKRINHVFTHFKLDCTIAFSRMNKDQSLNSLTNDKNYRFVKEKHLNKLAIPTLIKKILKYAQSENYFK